MTRFRFAAFLLAAACCGFAHADPCDTLPKPSVTVKRLESPFVVDTSRNYRELTQLGAALARPGRRVLGLTRGTALASFVVSAPAFVDPLGRWECASPQLTLTIGYSPLTVYVANEFAENSCPYREIYEHELRHVEAYQAHLAVIERNLADALTRRFATGGPWRGAVGETRALLQRELDQRWLPYVQRQIERGNVLQAEIDSPEEYARLAEACGGEIRERLR